MKCANCPYFKILHMSLHDDNAIYYFGKAKCMKHNHIVDFGCKGKFQKDKLYQKKEKAIDLMEL